MKDPALRRRRLVEALKKEARLRTPRVIQAFLDVPREAFVPPSRVRAAYKDNPLPIGAGQTISAPHMVAIMVEALDAQEGHRVLDVGTGSGYHAAILSRLVGPGGGVVSVEVVRRLAADAARRLRDLGYDNVEVYQGDGAAGWPDGAPYDRINVACAAPEVPNALVGQLADGGVMVVPVGRAPSRLIRVTRRGQDTRREDLGPCAFVPMMPEGGFSQAEDPEDAGWDVA